MITPSGFDVSRARGGLRAAPWVTILLALFLLPVTAVHAQPQMPDPRQMSGIPRPVDDLPNRSISVRVIRGAMTNNVPNQPVDLQVGSKVVTVKTDENGRAQFDEVTPGATVKAVAVVDGERLESQEFSAPADGGIRLLLVATASGGAADGAPSAPSVPAVSGEVVISNRSRIVFDPGEDGVRVDYLLAIANRASQPVNPTTPFAFDMPSDATRMTLMEGSSPRAKQTGKRVTFESPFPPGESFVHVAFEVPPVTGRLALTQRFPTAVDGLAVIVKKLGDTTLSSPQLVAQEEVPMNGEVFIAGTGTAIAAGQPIDLVVENLPHHSPAPRRTALALAVCIVGIGIWAALRPSDGGADRAADRKRLIGRREKLFGDLVRLENEHRLGKLPDARYAARREEIVNALEQIYGTLDSDDTTPGPADRTGLAA